MKLLFLDLTGGMEVRCLQYLPLVVSPLLWDGRLYTSIANMSFDPDLLPSFPCIHCLALDGDASMVFSCNFGLRYDFLFCFIVLSLTRFETFLLFRPRARSC
jgi:hypothetical protein